MLYHQQLSLWSYYTRRMDPVKHPMIAHVAYFDKETFSADLAPNPFPQFASLVPRHKFQSVNGEAYAVRNDPGL